MRNIFACFIVFALLSNTSIAQNIIFNKGPGHWTLVLDGERIVIPPFSSHPHHDGLQSLEFYAIEIRTDKSVYVHGFCSIKKNNRGYFILQDLEVIPIFVLNKTEEELWIEYHRRAFLLAPEESKVLEDPYLRHDSLIELKISGLDSDYQWQFHRVSFIEGIGIVEL